VYVHGYYEVVHGSYVGYYVFNNTSSNRRQTKLGGAIR
jgi:hypothetical protein